jgi:hypothetical protein
MNQEHQQAITLYAFGDSILDCGWYNAPGLNVGQLLVKNDDVLFPEFRGRDLCSYRTTRLIHCAVDGATVRDLARQAAGSSRRIRQLRSSPLAEMTSSTA